MEFGKFEFLRPFPLGNKAFFSTSTDAKLGQYADKASAELKKHIQLQWKMRKAQKVKMMWQQK